MVFRLIPTSMTLNDLERHNSPYFAYFSPNSIALPANYVTLVEDRPYENPLSAKYCLPGPVFHFGHNEPILQRGLSAIAELLVNVYNYMLFDAVGFLYRTKKMQDH